MALRTLSPPEMAAPLGRDMVETGKAAESEDGLGVRCTDEQLVEKASGWGLSGEAGKAL
jgi:hypothetical protein